MADVPDNVDYSPDSQVSWSVVLFFLFALINYTGIFELPLVGDSSSDTDPLTSSSNYGVGYQCVSFGIKASPMWPLQVWSQCASTTRQSEVSFSFTSEFPTPAGYSGASEVGSSFSVDKFFSLP